MKRFIPLMVLAAVTLFFLSSCENESTAPCSEIVTMRDLTGLDGCSFAFQLANGDYIRPLHYESIEPVKFVDGKKVTLDYKIIYGAWADACMVGEFVIISCISENIKLPD